MFPLGVRLSGGVLLVRVVAVLVQVVAVLVRVVDALVRVVARQQAWASAGAWPTLMLSNGKLWQMRGSGTSVSDASPRLARGRRII